MTLTFNRGINSSGTLLYFIDATTYGGINPARNSLAVVGFALYRASTGDVQIMPQAYLGESVATFTFDVVGNDGVWDAKFWGMPLYTGQILNDGDIVFDATDHQVKKRIAGVLTIIPVTQLLNETTAHSGEKNALIRTELGNKRDDLLLKWLERQEEFKDHNCEYHDVEKARNNFNYVKSMYVGAQIDFKRANYVNAQLKIERGNSFAIKALAEAA